MNRDKQPTLKYTKTRPQEARPSLLFRDRIAQIEYTMGQSPSTCLQILQQVLPSQRDQQIWELHYIGMHDICKRLTDIKFVRADDRQASYPFEPNPQQVENYLRTFRIYTGNYRSDKTFQVYHQLTDVEVQPSEIFLYNDKCTVVLDEVWRSGIIGEYITDETSLFFHMSKRGTCLTER